MMRTLVLVLTLATGCAACVAGPSEAASSGADRSAASCEIRTVLFERDGNGLNVVIPAGCAWEQSFLDGPPRIVIDLFGARSRLPRAPGLFEARFEEGVLAAVRTSQFRNTPGDLRTRIAFELRKRARYDARRTERGIRIAISDPGGPSGNFVLDANGLVPAVVPAAGPRPVPEPAEPVTAAVVRARIEPVFEPASAPAGRPPAAEPVAEPAPPGVQPHAEPVASTPAEPVASTPAPGRPARTLTEALRAAVGNDNVHPVTGSKPDETLGSVPAPSTAAGPVPARPAGSGSSATHGDPVPTTAAEVARAITRAESLATGGAVDGLGEAPATNPMEVRERSARRILRDAVRAFLAGDDARAIRLAARNRQFYPATPSGVQSSLLLREALLLSGNERDAEAVAETAEPPDSSRLPVEVFRSLVARFRSRPDLTDTDRLLRTWGPAYGPSGTFSDLHLGLAEAFVRAGQPDVARAHIELIAAGDPLEPRALLLLAGIQDEAGEKELALETYQRVAAIAGGAYRIRGLVRQADLAFQLGRTADALAVYVEVLGAAPPPDEEVWATYQAGNCLYLLGDRAQARDRYEAVAKRWPASFWAPFARNRLEDLSWHEQLSARSVR